jgi:hypothetical protein
MSAFLIYSIIYFFQEEGHFAKDGNFIWNKAEKDVQDAWLDNIDWVKVRLLFIFFSRFLFSVYFTFSISWQKIFTRKKTYTWYE